MQSDTLSGINIYCSNLRVNVALLTCCSMERRHIRCVGIQARTAREPMVHGLVVLGVALWSAEDETWGPVSAASKGSCTSWGLPTHLQVAVPIMMCHSSHWIVDMSA